MLTFLLTATGVAIGAIIVGVCVTIVVQLLAEEL